MQPLLFDPERRPIVAPTARICPSSTLNSTRRKRKDRSLGLALASATMDRISLWLGWVFELVSSSSHCAEGPEPVAELSTKSHLDGIVPAGGRWAQPLVGKDRGAGVPGGVVGEDVRAIRILVGYLACRFEVA